MADLKWDKITEHEFDAPISENFFVEVMNGRVMVRERNGGDYDHNMWYGYYWTFNKEKGRLVRRRVSVQNSVTECMAKVQEYVDCHSDEIIQRESEKVEDDHARQTADEIANMMGIPKRKRPVTKENKAITGFVTYSRVIDLSDN